MKAVGLRARLAVTLVAVALFAVGLAALIGNLGLGSQLNSAARARLQGTAAHVAAIAAAAYDASGGWSPDVRSELAHVAALDGLDIALRVPDARVIATGTQPRGATAEAPVVASDKRVATTVVSSAGGSLLSPEERHLAHSLDDLHLLAAGVAALAAILVGLLLARSLAQPLRRIRVVAERLDRGELQARVAAGSEPETGAVGRALNRLAETLEREEELRKESVADLAHELRTPVNGLLGRIEAAEDGVLTGPENLAAMHAEALRLTRLLDDLSRLADAERPGLLVDKAPLDLGEVARAVCRSFAPRFAAKGVGFQTSIEPTLVDGDPGRLEQIVSNLLANALAYTDPGGQVTVIVAGSDAEAILEVADTGVGIAAEDLPNIFTRLWRSERSRVEGGTGIGLAIARELVRAHDGRIEVESSPGHGARFRVNLPSSTHASAVAASPRPASRRSAP